MRADWRHPLLVLPGCALLALALVLEPWWFQRAQHARHIEYQRLAAALGQARQTTLDAGDTIARLQAPVLELAGRGVLGTDPFLPWLEVLRDAGQRLDLPTLSWRLDSPGPARTIAVPTGAGLEVYASPLTLEVDLPRAAALPPLLALLTAPHNGLVTVRSCHLQALGAEGLHARCTLERWTLTVVAPPA